MASFEVGRCLLSSCNLYKLSIVTAYELVYEEYESLDTDIGPYWHRVLHTLGYTGNIYDSTCTIRELEGARHRCYQCGMLSIGP